jgi:hypothetical protein
MPPKRSHQTNGILTRCRCPIPEASFRAIDTLGGHAKEVDSRGTATTAVVGSGPRDQIAAGTAIHADEPYRFPGNVIDADGDGRIDPQTEEDIEDRTEGIGIETPLLKENLLFHKG